MELQSNLEVTGSYTNREAAAVGAWNNGQNFATERTADGGQRVLLPDDTPFCPRPASCGMRVETDKKGFKVNCAKLDCNGQARIQNVAEKIVNRVGEITTAYNIFVES